MIPLLFTCEAENQDRYGLGTAESGQPSGISVVLPPASFESDPAQAGIPGWLAAPHPRNGTMWACSILSRRLCPQGQALTCC